MGPFSVDEGRKMTATTSCAVAFLIGIVVRATSGQVPCSFEDGLCGWVQVNDGTDGNINGNVDWISNSGKTQTGDRTGLTGPDNDHTFGNATGKYLFFESSGNPNQKVTTAKLISPTIEPGIYCFRFWHHMYGSSTGKLQVNLNTGNISTTKWQLEHDQGRTWIESMVTLNVTSNSTVELKAIHNMLSAGYYLGDISIDDTNLEQGSCPDVSYNCTFEEANYCLWNRDDGLDELKTFWINNLASSSNAGPSTDKTLGTSSGRYLLLDTSATSPTLIASLYSNSIEGGQAKCLSFWYHMYGVNAANLSVYIVKDGTTEPECVWHTSGNLRGDIWNKGQYTIDTDSPYTIRIDGVAGGGAEGDIGVDDIELTDGRCPDTCDFEEGICTWSQSANGDDANWLRHLPQEEFDGLLKDHTLGTAEGHFIHIEGLTAGSTAILTSPVLRDDVCLTFWLNMPEVSSGSVEVYPIAGTDETAIANRTTLTINKDQGEMWSKYQLSVTGISHDPYKLAIKGTQGTSATSFIAIDDLKIEYGQACPEPTAELTNFDQDLGVWTVDSGLWVRHGGSNNITDFAPNPGPSLKAEEDSVLAYTHVDNSPNASACLTLDYHMYGHFVGELFITYGVNYTAHIDGNQGNLWNKASFDVKGLQDGPVKLSIKSQLGHALAMNGTTKGTNAIDNVKVSNKSCSDTYEDWTEFEQITANFLENMGGWSNKISLLNDTTLHNTTNPFSRAVFDDVGYLILEHDPNLSTDGSVIAIIESPADIYTVNQTFGYEFCVTVNATQSFPPMIIQTASQNAQVSVQEENADLHRRLSLTIDPSTSTNDYEQIIIYVNATSSGSVRFYGFEVKQVDLKADECDNWPSINNNATFEFDVFTNCWRRDFEQALYWENVTDPDIAHESNGFLKTGETGVTGDKAVLISQPIPGEVPKSEFEFWYKYHNVSLPKLPKLKIIEGRRDPLDPAKTYANEQEIELTPAGAWTYVLVKMENTNPTVDTVIMIVAEKQDDTPGIIYLDSFTLRLNQTGGIPEEINCDFSNNLCAWEHLSWDTRWTRFFSSISAYIEATNAIRDTHENSTAILVTKNYLENVPFKNYSLSYNFSFTYSMDNLNQNGLHVYVANDDGKVVAEKLISAVTNGWETDHLVIHGCDLAQGAEKPEKPLKIYISSYFGNDQGENVKVKDVSIETFEDPLRICKHIPTKVYVKKDKCAYYFPEEEVHAHALARVKPHSVLTGYTLNFFAKFEAYNESHKFVPLSGYIKENDQYGPKVYSSLMSDFDLGIVVALNRWIQITQIWSGSLNEWTLYVDGNEFDKKKTTVQRIFPTDYMVIGQSLRGNYEDFESCNVTSFNTHDRFSGTLSRFQMWDYALGGDELKEVLSGVTNYTLVPPGDFLIGTYFARSGAEGFSECASHCYSKDSPRNFEVCGENRYGYSLWSMDEYDNTTWTGLCQTGKSQSPINIGEVDSSNDQGVEFDLFGYKDVVLKNYDLLNDGHVIKLIIDPAQSPLIKIRIDGTNHTLKYLELHWPGEHMLSDNRESLEIYFVHQPANDPNGNYTILSVRYHLEKDNENRRNPWMDTLIPAIECVTEPNWIPLNGASKPHVYLSEFAGSISNLKNFYRYTGSLTTPPCTENVDYWILRQSSWLSLNQYELFFNILRCNYGFAPGYVPTMYGNYRRAQVKNGRTVTGYWSDDYFQK